MEKRSFKKLQKSMDVEEFKVFCKKVATEYARSEGEFARSYFVEHYNISQQCYYKMLEYAIVYHLVPEKDVNMMETKALLNQKNHSANAGMTTRLHYAELRKKRDEYTISMYFDDDIATLAEDFAESKLSKKDFAEKYDISTKVLDQLLKKAIVENIIDDVTFIAIKERSVAVNSSKQVVEFFKTLLQERLLYAQKTVP